MGTQNIYWGQTHWEFCPSRAVTPTMWLTLPQVPVLLGTILQAVFRSASDPDPDPDPIPDPDLDLDLDPNPSRLSW